MTKPFRKFKRGFLSIICKFFGHKYPRNVRVGPGMSMIGTKCERGCDYYNITTIDGKTGKREHLREELK